MLSNDFLDDKYQIIENDTKVDVNENGHIIKIFTDGSCPRNGMSDAVGGIGIHFPLQEVPNISLVYRGYKLNVCPKTGQMLNESVGTGQITNQRAELNAIHVAIELAITIPGYEQNKSSIHIFTDSGYSIDVFTKWINSWEMNGWMTSNKKPVKNRDIISPLGELIKNHKVIFTHINSHENSIADSLAKKASNSVQVKIKKPRKKKLKINKL